MKVLADRGACQGYGNCVITEPRVFDVDDDGLVKLVADDPADEFRAGVRQAVRDCPARALALEE